MNDKLFKTIKILAPIATFGVGLLTSYVSNKELDEKITKKAAEAIANVSKEEA